MNNFALYSWAAKIFIDTIFSTNNIENVNSILVVTEDHYYRFLANLCVFISILAYNLKNQSWIKNSYIKLMVAYYGYAGLTGFVSSSLLTTLGNAFYAIEYVLLGVTVANVAAKEANGLKRLGSLLKQWSTILILMYFSSAFIYYEELPFTAMDEKSLIAIIVFLLMKRYTIRYYTYLLMPLVAIFGKSFSALVCGFIYYCISNITKIRVSSIIAIQMTILGLFYLYSQLVDGSITVYGKSIDHFITGSGRFEVWSALWEEIEKSSLNELIFGHGFMSERTALADYNLPWIVDVHNNVLQVIYGTGLIGLFFLCLLALYPAFIDQKKIMYTKSIIVNVNIVLLLFGVTSSTFISRPSISLSFFCSLMLLALYKPKVRNENIS